MNYEYLNEMIDYIENHLTDKIDFKKLAKIVGISDYSLQRIFIFLSGISLTEYIKRRRLSKAFEELRNTDIKIIDLALKYDYDSSSSFSRAFKKYFNMNPSTCRKTDKKYKLYPVIKFNKNNICSEFDYEIKEVDEKVIYAYKVEAKSHDDFLFKIRELYIKFNQIKKELSEYFAIVNWDEEKYSYYLGGTKKIDNSEKIIIKKGKYAVFHAGKTEQKNIIKNINEIYSCWYSSTNFVIKDSYNFEYYKDNNCYIYIPIKDKQN